MAKFIISEKVVIELNAVGEIAISSVACALGGVAIGAPFGACQILTKTGIIAKICIFGCLRKSISGEIKNDKVQTETPVSWARTRSPSMDNSSPCEIQGVFTASIHRYF